MGTTGKRPPNPQGPTTGEATTTSAAAAAAENVETATPPFPPPTESVGCEAHGEHYDCSGPTNTAATATSTATAAAEGEDGQDHNHEGATPSFPPPTPSVGCVTHGDHYDCAGPANTAATATSTATAAAEGGGDGHDHDHEEEAPSFPPPTESVGCEAHGDHYHCSGPAGQATTPPTANGTYAGTNGTSVSTNGTSVLPFEGAASSSRVISFVAMTGLIGVVGLMLVL
ncbi:MAG: hypothetical protein Q9188_003207 [Gyalolechia gomerana]